MPQLVCALTDHHTPYAFASRVADSRGRHDATIQDLVKEVAEHHDVHCACDRKVGTSAWATSVALDGGCLRRVSPLGRDALPPQTELRSILRRNGPHASLLIATLQRAGSGQDFLGGEDRPTFVVDPGVVVVGHHKGPHVLPLGVSDYEKMCSTPGLVFVDKSRHVSAMLAQFSRSRVNIIRAPKGFGRTTFLSTLSAYFDAFSPHAHFACGTEPITGPVSEARHRLLVFSLDLGSIDWRTDMETHVHHEECSRAMDAAAAMFYARYRTVLEAPNSGDDTRGFNPTFSKVIARARARGWGLFLALDNYNSVMHNDPYGVLEDSISGSILDRLSSLVLGGPFSYGLIVGEAMTGPSSWRRVPSIFTDVTEVDEFKGAFGFTMDEISALGSALALDLQGALASRCMQKLDDARISYCSADVLSMARNLLVERNTNAPAARSVDVRYVVHDYATPPTPSYVESPRPESADELDSMIVDCDPDLPDYQMLDEETDEVTDEDADEDSYEDPYEDTYEDTYGSLDPAVPPPLVADTSSDGSSSRRSSGGNEPVGTADFDVLPVMVLPCSDKKR